MSGIEKQFLEEYIHLEKICNEIFGENHGVSKYIEEMEGIENYYKYRISDWNNTYKKLKNLRWKRNIYVHEGVVEFDKTDIIWLKDFYKQIMNSKDPLSIVYKSENVNKSLTRSNPIRINNMINNINNNTRNTNYNNEYYTNRGNKTKVKNMSNKKRNKKSKALIIILLIILLLLFALCFFCFFKDFFLI